MCIVLLEQVLCGFLLKKDKNELIPLHHIINEPMRSKAVLSKICAVCSVQSKVCELSTGQIFFSDISAVPKTRCERERERALAEQSSRPNSAGPVYQPLCTEAGAYEPLQYHPQGYYMCVDINGRELSRHNDEPECKYAVRYAVKLATFGLYLSFKFNGEIEFFFS